MKKFRTVLLLYICMYKMVSAGRTTINLKFIMPSTTAALTAGFGYGMIGYKLVLIVPNGLSLEGNEFEQSKSF